jgi:hypothetical protein
MNVITNQKLIARNRRFAVWGQIIGLGMLVVATTLTFRSAEQLGLSLLLLGFGFLTSQIGIALGNRWLKRPRPDEHLNTALKGLDKEYTLYHYQTPVSHLLVGPAGVWTLIPYRIGGTISFGESRNRWTQRGSGLLARLFGQESLGRPDLEIAAQSDALAKHFNRNWQADFNLKLNEALVFTNEKVVLELENSPIPALHARKLKDFIRQQAKQGRMPPAQIPQVIAALTE